MKNTALILFVILFSAAAHAQTPRPTTTAAACKKSSGTNVFVNLDARSTTFAKDSQHVHISPAKSLDLISRLESKLDAQGFCVFHNDEFDGAGHPSFGVLPGTTPHIEIAFLARVMSFPKSDEILVYSLQSGDWTTVPLLPYFNLDDKADIAALAEQLANTVKGFQASKK